MLGIANPLIHAIMYPLVRIQPLPPHGIVAQLVEHTPDKGAVTSSSLVGSIDNHSESCYDCLVQIGTVAESVDAPDLKSVGHLPVRVQVSLVLFSTK